MLTRSSITLLILLIFVGCAARQNEVQGPDQALPLPEVRSVTFEGNEQFSDRTLRAAIASTPRPFFPPWKRGEPFNESTLDADLKRVQKYYFDRGFLQTQVTIDHVKQDEENNTVDITIAIEEGLPTQVKTVRIVGHVPEALPSEEQMIADLPLRAGAPITKADFDRSQAQLIGMMKDQGYARADVVPQTEVDFDTHEAIVTFALEPGELSAIGDIAVSGNELVEERAIRRQLYIEPGDVYSEEHIKDTHDAIFGMGMFTSVTPRITNLEAEDAPLAIDIKVQERKPRTFEIQAGYSTVEGPRLRLAWTHRNFFHGSEQLTVEGRGSFIRQEAKATLRFPYFLARRTRFTQTLAVTNDYLLSDALGVVDPQPAYDLFSISTVGQIDHELIEDLTASVGLDLSSNNFYNVKPDRDTLESTQDNILFIQYAELSYDTRDDLLNATRGYLLRGRMENSTTTVLSDVDFAKFIVEGRHYLPIWWRMVFATRLLLGGIQPYGSTSASQIPGNVRFFAGGPGSVRGFELNRLGPLDSDGDPIGGNSLIEGSAELRFPIFGQLFGALFLDFGNVFLEPFTYRFDDLRYAAGPGIRYLTPIGPIRLDVGFILDPREGENTSRLEFSIGQAF